jgi:hypothetical protein
LSIQCHALRSEQRTQAHVNVIVKHTQTNTLLFDGLMIDLSLSGCRVSVNRDWVSEKLTANEKLTLTLNSFDGQVVELTATVMNQKVDETRYYFGLKFDGSEKIVEGLLHKLMIS